MAVLRGGWGAGKLWPQAHAYGSQKGPHTQKKIEIIKKRALQMFLPPDPSTINMLAMSNVRYFWSSHNVCQ